MGAADRGVFADASVMGLLFSAAMTPKDLVAVEELIVDGW